MNPTQRKLVKIVYATLCLTMIHGYGQKQTKSYKETFKVGNDAVININTSHADIEFATWAKNEVRVEATIEIEGASEEEAQDYFGEAGIKILGNSNTIEITTGSENSLFSRQTFAGLKDLHVEIPELPDLEPLFLDLELPEFETMVPFMEMPPMPPMSFQNFDYEAYEKDGEKYLKEWKKDFDKNFDGEYKKQFEVWKERMDENREKMQVRAEEQKEVMRAQRQLQEAQRNEMRKNAQEHRKAAMELRQKVLNEQQEERRHILINRNRSRDGEILFYGPGNDGDFKIKKLIKIWMPKSTKLKMNVRHGEVKLAENTEDINATLSYAKLLATNIHGEKTTIVASYSPVYVEHWTFGKLRTEFSDKVALKEVVDLTLTSTSSDVTIDRLLKSAQIKNDLGALHINSISDNFSNMNVSIQNGGFVCRLPSTAFTIEVNGFSTTLESPKNSTLIKEKNNGRRLLKGYNIDKNSNQSIVINANYGEVLLEKN